jgi:hypothetical protein
MRLRRRFIEQSGIGKILNGHVSLHIGDAELPAVDVTLTRLGLDVFPIELESSAHMRAIIPTPGAAWSHYRAKRNTPRADDNASTLFESVTVLSPLSRLV